MFDPQATGQACAANWHGNANLRQRNLMLLDQSTFGPDYEENALAADRLSLFPAFKADAKM